MARQLNFAVLLVALFAFSFGECLNEQLTSKVVEVNAAYNLTEFLSLNSSGILLQRLVKEEIAKNPTERFTIIYKLGDRKYGDSLQATKTESFNYGSAQNVKLTLNYPASGYGATVTYVQINVQQSTNLGRAYVQSGGVGQRFIGIVVESSNTYYFKYDAYIYGYY